MRATPSKNLLVGRLPRNYDHILKTIGFLFLQVKIFTTTIIGSILFIFVADLSINLYTAIIKAI